jgi:DNA-binding beta-propeller fold protein YncE
VTNNISQYTRNTETGTLTAQTPASIATATNPEGIAITPDGKNVYATNHGSANVSQFWRSQ